MLGVHEIMNTTESSSGSNGTTSNSAEIKLPKLPPKSPARSSDGSSSPTSLTFSWARMVAEQEEEEGEHNQSPHLWRPGSSMSNPSHPMSIRAQEIARGRQELMKLYEGMPESAYELSLKDLVDQKAAMDKHKMGISDEARTKTRIKGNSNKRRPLKGNYPKSFLLNIFIPSSLTVRPTPPPSRPLSRNPSRGSNDQSGKNKTKHHTNPLLSLFRIRPSKGSELSHCNSFSKVSPKPYSGLSDLSFMGSPTEAKPNNSSRCSACSGYTVFFMTNCQACEKIYCSNCSKEAMADTPNGRRCRTTCTDISYKDRDLELEPKMKKGCWARSFRKKIKSERRTKKSFREDEIDSY